VVRDHHGWLGGGRPNGERRESVGEGEGDGVRVGGGVIWWWRWILMEKEREVKEVIMRVMLDVKVVVMEVVL